LRVGDLELRAGRWRAADAAFRAGLAVEPDDPRLAAAMARLAFAQGDMSTSIAWGERAIGLQLDPATLGLLADAYTALGDSARATEYSSTLDIAVSAQPGAYHRAWSLHLLDHNVQVEEVQRRAVAELRERKDVYAYDILAWAQFKAGQIAAAQATMRQAMRLGTPDPLLRRHAEQIDAAVMASVASASTTSGATSVASPSPISTER
jgi:tetratricopeptide (TPR) repeat protein